MKKNGIIYRHIAELSIKNRSAKFVSREIARELKVSPNTVSLAILPLTKIGAIAGYRRHFEVLNLSKLLLYWAVNRKFDKDIAYKTYVEVKSPAEIEKRMPSDIAYTDYSAYVKLFGNDASDYSSVYVYVTDSSMEEIKKRFPPLEFSKKVKRYNLFALNADYVLASRIRDRELDHSSVPLSQLYVDLWNNSEWYAYEFLKKLKVRIDEIYGKAILE